MTPEEKYTFIHNFLPHAQRKTRARLIQNKAFFVYCLLLVAVFAIFSVVPKMYPGILGFASSISVGDLFKYANRTREEAGLADLRLNPELTKAAEAKAADMFKDDYWAHVSPKTGKEPWDFILAQDYDYFIAQATLMGKLAVVFGKALGARGKMPNPKAGGVIMPGANVKDIASKFKSNLRIRNNKEIIMKVSVGKEDFTDDVLADNIVAICEAVHHALPNGEANIKDTIVKFFIPVFFSNCISIIDNCKFVFVFQFWK